MLVVCLNGTFTIEQPKQSFFEFFPRWRDFLEKLRAAHDQVDVVGDPNR